MTAKKKSYLIYFSNCPTCGNLFTHKHTGKNRIYCSYNCCRGNKINVYFSNCLNCGHLFTHRYKHKKYCCKGCQRKAQWQLDKIKQVTGIYFKGCKSCNRLFTTRQSKSCFCSKKCESAYWHDVRRPLEQWYRDNLSDYYIKAIFSKKPGIKLSDTPPHIIPILREKIRLEREIKLSKYETSKNS